MPLSSIRRGAVTALTALTLLLAPDTLATGPVWDRKRVPVFDFTSVEWRSIVQDTVADFNAMLPKRAPRLVYRSMPERSCGDLPKRERKRRITVCSVPYSGDAEGSALVAAHRGALVRATIKVMGTNAVLMDRTVCHEFMHATTGIPDAKGEPRPEASCVHGFLNDPGPFDARYARRAYRPHAHRHR